MCLSMAKIKARTFVVDVWLAFNRVMKKSFEWIKAANK